MKTTGDIIVGFIVIGILIGGKILIDNSYIGHWFNARGYEILHSFIPSFDPKNELPVVVLDISDMEREPDGTTPSKTLREIVEGLIQSKAKAIAIDIDFSPRIDPQNPARMGARSENDQEFFGFLHEQKKMGTPVFLGVYNVGVESEGWLGLEENKGLASDMTLFDEDTTQVPMWLRCGNGDKLNSISNALAEAYGKRPSPLWIFENLEDHHNLKQTVIEDKSGKQVSCESAFTFVNYAKLEIIQNLTLQANDKNSVFSHKNAEGKSKFQDKLVIIGNTQRGKACDCFVVNGRNKPVTGAFIHASAVYSLVAEPVYKFKHGISIALDIILGLIIVVGVIIIRFKYQWKPGFSLHIWESRFIIFSIIITLLLGYLLAWLFDVLWLDFLLVIFALLLHSKVTEWVLLIPTLFFIKKKPQSPTGIK